MGILELPQLAQHRLLCFMYKIVHGLYFPPNVVVLSRARLHNLTHTCTHSARLDSQFTI